MDLRNLIVYVSNEPGIEVALAVDLARAHDANLTGLHIFDIPLPPTGIEASVAGLYIEAQRRSFFEEGASVRAQVLETARKAGYPLAWQVGEGDTVDVLSSRARYCDLVVIGEGAGMDEPTNKRGVCERTILQSGKPVVVVPEDYAGSDLGRSVVVAWDGSRAAARAVTDAMPLLRKAVDVAVVVVERGRDMDRLGERPGADICGYLARHGVKAEAHMTHAGSASVGQTLSRWATDRGADLLVMGAYGHWRIRELILGGVTQDVLRDLHLPVLMSH